jgi:uncharacterized protein with ParB-like and HNH nuclease domain
MNNFENKLALLEKEVSDERKRLSSDRLDISFGELINLYKNGELIIRPEYQRLFRWTKAQKTALIESILLSIPIPPIFVSEDNNGVWELVDGLQRVSTFISFFGNLLNDSPEIKTSGEATKLPNENQDQENEDQDEEQDEEQEFEQAGVENKWILGEGGLIKSLEGFNIDNLPANLKINLKRAVCRVEILRGESNTSMKYELFKRLNSGGSKLTPQEIRNAIYRGIDSRLNELLLKTSRNEIFRTLTRLTDNKLNELYDQELVLRFFAFYRSADKVNENMEKFLNNFMEETVKNKEFDYDELESTFINVLNLVNRLGDDGVFRNKNATSLFVPANFEGILIGIAQNIDKYTDNLELLREKIEQLKSDEIFKRYSGTASNSRSRIKNRLKRADEIFRS